MTKFQVERQIILQFMAEQTKEEKKGHVYLRDLLAAYNKWRVSNDMKKSTLSLHSFGRAMSGHYERKLCNRGTYRPDKRALNPARAIMGLVLR